MLNCFSYLKLTKGKFKENYKTYDYSKLGLYSTRNTEYIITSHNTYH